MMKHFEILTDAPSIEALRHLLGQSVVEIYTHRIIEHHTPLLYPFDETEPQDDFYMSDQLSGNCWLLPCQNQYVLIATDWGDLQELYWRDFYTRDCKILAAENIKGSTLFIKLEQSFILDSVRQIELYAWQASEDIGYLLSDCAVRLIAENGQSIMIANDSNILGSSRIILRPEFQKRFIDKFCAFPRMLITQSGVQLCEIPPIEHCNWDGYR
jgi:hypothetical protein